MPGLRFSEGVLAPEEDLVLDIKPHWIALAKPAAEGLGLVAVATLVWLVLPYSWGPWPFVLTILAAGTAFALGPARAFVGWETSHFVLTTERIMRRSGWVGKQSIEIPLDHITDVRFAQTILERLIGAGDLTIDSASVQEVLPDMPKPERLQRTIYEIKERRLRARTDLTSADAPARQNGLAPAAASVADEITKLHALLGAGALTDEEFQTAKARLLRRV